jgi:MFS family permease
MGYSALSSQALAAPPYLFSFVTVLITASLSDRYRSRSPFIIAHALLSSLAYLLIAFTGHLHARLSTSLQVIIKYICIYPAAAGFFSAITIIITWTLDNQPAKEGKGTGMVVLNIIGQCGPLLGTRLYPASDGPRYVKGMTICSIFMLVVAGLAFVLRLILQRENLRFSRKGSGQEEEIEMVEGEAEGLMGSGISRARSGLSLEKTMGSSRFTYIV